MTVSVPEQYSGPRLANRQLGDGNHLLDAFTLEYVPWLFAK
jgi:hypothetical protein